MACVYILHSEKLNRFYIGSTVDSKLRLLDHLLKTFPNSFTKASDDWTLFLTISNLGYNQARQIEKHIKKMKSKVYIKNLSRHSEMIEKLKSKYSD